MFNLNSEGILENCLVIIQCDSGHLNGDLIACARYRIYDLKVKADKKQITHVLFIVYLPHQVVKSSFVSFQGDPWISSHIDDLRPTANNAVSANKAMGLSISDIFLGTAHHEPKSLEASDVGLCEQEDELIIKKESTGDLSSLEPSVTITSKDMLPNPQDETYSQIEPVVSLPNRSPLYCRLHGCIQAAASKLQDSSYISKRCTKRVEILVHLISKAAPKEIGKCIRVIHVCTIIQHI